MKSWLLLVVCVALLHVSPASADCTLAFAPPALQQAAREHYYRSSKRDATPPGQLSPSAAPGTMANQKRGSSTMPLPRSLALLPLALALPFAPAQASTDTRDNPEIRAVIESFRTSIIQRDRERFLALFVQPEVPWQSVVDDPALAQIRLKRPEAIKARFKQENNPVAFIDGIVKSANTSEETFSNIRIDSDGEVAAVTFDYSFLSNGKATNWGKECWLMVRTGEGWKITTLAYSIKLPPAPK